MDSTSWWALLLDLDGTLIQTDVLHRSLWTEILASYGLDVTEESYHQRIAGRSDAEIWTEWKVGTSEEHTQWNTWKESAFLQRLQETVPTPGGRELVEDWIRAGQWVGVVTNSNATTATALLDRLGIRDLDVCITSDSGCAPKPSPAPYQMALNELGISPKHCIIVEDSEVGLQSAREVGPARLFRVVPSALDSLSIQNEIPIRDLTDSRLAPPMVWRPSWLAP
jgi:HAD superfamily hydrolase (TIGR01509 family)